MSARDLRKPSETNRAKVEEMTDEKVDTSDISPLSEEFFTGARLRMPGKKVSVILDVDADVLA